MADLAAAYAMNVAENPFGDGDGYGRYGAVLSSANPATPASPATGTSARSGIATEHHFAFIIAIGAALLILSHRIGFRGAVAV